MSPILDLQRRLREVGRIRLGQTVKTSGKSRPAKLDRFRLTSRDERVIRAAADLYGGNAAPWDTPDGKQWEVITEALEMAVIVPPGDMSLSQWLELWSGGGCVRRCDGVTEYLHDGPCLCDPAARECKTTTRLSVMLPDVPGFGLWRVETHGYYAATELAGVVELCRQASAAGHMLPARLRLEQRSVKRIDKGKPVTLKFAVPVLDLDVSPASLGELSSGGTWSPVPVAELAEPPSPSMAESLAELETPKPRRPRANAAAPIKPTGLAPRTVADLVSDERDERLASLTQPGLETDEPDPHRMTGAQFLIWARKQAHDAGVVAPSTEAEAREAFAEFERMNELPPVSDITPATRRKLFALVGEMWPDETDERRRGLLLELAAEVGYPGLKSRTEIGQELGARLIDELTEMVAIGT